MVSPNDDSKSSISSNFLSAESFNVERIFPIRNLVNEIDQSGEEKETLFLGSKPIAILSSEPTYPARNLLPPSSPETQAEEKLRKVDPTTSDSEHTTQSDGEEGRVKSRKVTERAQLASEKYEGTPGTTFTEGGKTTFHRCEDEPIHIPGAIQSYGALVALTYADDGEGDILVRIASENSQLVLGYTPEELFRLASFCDLLDASCKQDFVARFVHVLQAGHDSSPNTDLDVFTLGLLTPSGDIRHYWCGLHLTAGTNDIVICEVEARDDSFFPGVLAVHTLPEIPIITVGNDVVEEERLKSVTSKSGVIRALSLARQRNARLGYMEMFNTMSQVQAQLGGTKTLQDALDAIVGVVQEMCHFHRVMVYRFDQDYNGAVVAELVDPRASGDFFRGLHFPASDIPKQARELYKINKIRVLYDRDAETARLVCRDEVDFDRPLDLTHSYLRAISPVHLKYLANMGVRSSMSISLIINNQLWGLVACHSYGEYGIQVPLPIRELCRNIGECASLNIERLVMASRLSARRPLAYIAPPRNPSGFIAASSSDLLNMFDADFGMLSIQEEARTIGKPAPYREALAILGHLQKKKFNTIVASQKIGADFPDIKYAPGISSIAGLLVIPLSLLGTDFIVFFRLSHLKEVRWAGNPYEKVVKEGTAQYLEPRSSFHRWTEKVEGTSKEWTDDQLETASILSLIYGRFVQVWRQKEMAVQRSRMTRLLIRNSSHEVRTPLNAIINYLEIALEQNLDDGLCEIIQKAHKSSRSLIYVIDDLLNLTKVEDGSIFTPSETFDLVATVFEVIMTFKKESIRRGLELSISTHPGLPSLVKGDPARLRQVLSNVTSNAFQSTTTGGVKVDITPIKVKEKKCVVSITIQDRGTGMSEKQLDDLFQDFEQIIDDDDQDDGSPKSLNDKRTLGVGLAVVARYVRNMNGQINVKSELGKGTIFTIELPFDCVGTPLTAIHAGSSSLAAFPIDLTPGSTISERLAEHFSSSTDPSTPVDMPPFSTESRITVLGSEAPTLESLEVPSISLHTGRPIVEAAKHELTLGESPSGNSPERLMYPFPDMTNYSWRKLKILVAEDNPINARMLKKRLERSGHEVHVADDGQSCFDVIQQMSAQFDAVLMDLQMPLIDGHASTRMIRCLEKERDQLGGGLQLANRRRVPIFAVSASLNEAQRFEYVQDGFDGWVLKPINYNRLEQLLLGVSSRNTRRRSVYMPGEWEAGGWFLS